MAPTTAKNKFDTHHKKGRPEGRPFCNQLERQSHVEEDGLVIALQNNVECIDRLAILL